MEFLVLLKIFHFTILKAIIFLFCRNCYEFLAKNKRKEKEKEKSRKEKDNRRSLNITSIEPNSLLEHFKTFCIYCTHFHCPTFKTGGKIDIVFPLIIIYISRFYLNHISNANNRYLGYYNFSTRNSTPWESWTFSSWRRQSNSFPSNFQKIFLSPPNNFSTKVKGCEQKGLKILEQSKQWWSRWF